MHHRLRRFGPIVFVILALVPLTAAVSRQNAEAFDKKVVRIRALATSPTASARRTPVSQDEVNSWFTYRSQALLPGGVTQPQITILGAGRVTATAVVDLDAVAKRKATGSLLDPWSLLGGRVPLNITGILHTKGGVGRFELQRADISGVPVPVSIVQELVSYYSKTEANPDGVRLNDTFNLPAKIQQIDVGQGSAVVVQ